MGCAPSHLRTGVRESEVFNLLGKPGVASEVCHKIDPSVFRPAVDPLAPVRPQILRQYLRTVIHSEAYLVIGVGEQGDDDILEIIRAAREHRGESALSVMHILLRVPVSETLSYIIAHLLPHRETGCVGKIRRKNRIAAESHPDQPHASVCQLGLVRSLLDVLRQKAQRLAPSGFVHVLLCESPLQVGILTTNSFEQSIPESARREELLELLMLEAEGRSWKVHPYKDMVLREFIEHSRRLGPFAQLAGFFHGCAY